jgi:hypothetical protein
MKVWCAENITHSLEVLSRTSQSFKIPGQISVVNTKTAQPCILLAKSIHSRAVREKYYKDKGVEIDFASLDNVWQEAEDYANYLRNGHKKANYRFIVYPNDINWINNVCVVSRIGVGIESRFDQNRIVDPEVRSRVKMLRAQREYNTGAAKQVGHNKKHGEELTSGFDDIYQLYHGKMKENFFPPYEQTLPLLAEGEKHPLAWFTDQFEDN